MRPRNGSTNPIRNQMKNELPFARPMRPVARPNEARMMTSDIPPHCEGWRGRPGWSRRLVLWLPRGPAAPPGRAFPRRREAGAVIRLRLTLLLQLLLRLLRRLHRERRVASRANRHLGRLHRLPRFGERAGVGHGDG